MAYYDVTSEQHATYGTGTHRSERFVALGGEYPSQLKWSDLHPPGVKVLPKGSPPAGPGEINWEDTLGGKFAAALRRLEGLLYAVYGSRPAAYPKQPSGYDKCQWYDRLHPRCLWGPENWKPNILKGPPGCSSAGECWDYEIYEYAATGASAYGYPRPSVPIRSRSGDPAYQYLRGMHDRIYFPAGSVSRTQSASPHDPEGFGWFGATQPGRNDADANPWLSAANGYTWKTGEIVTFSYVLPTGVQTPTNMRLYYKTRPPDGTWTAWTYATMTGGPPTYTAQLGPYQHGTECRWYVRYFYDDPEPGADVYRYDPGALAAPSDDDAYYVQWFTHFNPYAYGLPEMLEDYGGTDIRHGTDHYEFDGAEVVQPGLLNLARFVLSAVCGSTCLWDDTGCREGAGHPGSFHHSPRIRPGGQSYCCISWPIRWYWSGANKYPQYRRHGKGDPESLPPLDTRPLKNISNEPLYGLAAARRAWRGIENLYRDLPMNNPKYGQGASWGVPAFELVLWHEPEYAVDAEVFAKFTAVGLREGDVIDAVHIQEIIDAVDYLIDYGVWTHDQVKSCKKSVTYYHSKRCGLRVKDWTSGPNHDPGPPWLCADCSGGRHYRYYWERYHPCYGCCGPTSECSSPEMYYEQVNLIWQEHDENGYHVTHEDGALTYNPNNQHCDAHPTPTYSECWNQNGDCSPGKCLLQANKQKVCNTWYWLSYGAADCYDNEWHICVGCDGNITGGAWPCEAPPAGCGLYKCTRRCYWWSGWDQAWIHCTQKDSIGGTIYAPCNASYSVAVSGLAYHVCTGPQCRPGWDSDHGGGWKKRRFDHTWHPELYEVATGPPGYEFSGNCFGDIYVCGSLETGAHPNLWFQERRGVEWEGMAGTWWTETCNCNAVSLGGCPPNAYDQLPPEIPGYGLHSLDGSPLCNEYWHYRFGGSQQGTDGFQCGCEASDFAVCLGDEAWVAVDLNLDGGGRPYRTYAGLDNELTPWTGPGVPQLRPYSLTKDPATWMHDCPCETWTGAGECA